MIIILFVLIIILFALMIAIQFSETLDKTDIAGIQFWLLIASLSFSLTIGMHIVENDVEEIMKKNNIIEYKVNDKKDVKAVLVDSSKFSKEIYERVIDDE